MKESVRRERFTKVASNRVQKVIDYLGLLQNCANRNNYEYDQEDVELMFNAITKALKETRNVYDKELNHASRSGFTFNK